MSEDQVGPRGGKTTRKRGQVQKTVWLDREEAEALREAAYKERRSEASIVREALRGCFEIED
ncbi:MAG: hypothetical protein GKS06_03015 [Acidobacteria bacterium]|nr:hypothetical protein [Acidobacteriota bacterium]